MKKEKKRKRLKAAAVGFALIILIAAAVGIKIFVDGSGGADPAAAEPGNKGGVQSAGSQADPDGGSDPADAVSGRAADDWRLLLVNGENPLPEDYTVETRALPNGLRFDTRAYDSLMDMLNDGREQGLSFVVCSAYRTSELQTQLFEAQIAKQRQKGLTEAEAYAVAKTIVAVPGTSEHQLGLAADIVALDYQVLDRGYAETPEAKWLAEHAHEYGFILRYPADKEEITKIIYEPWHFRYVGKEHAREMKERGLCLEEYIAALRV